MSYLLGDLLTKRMREWAIGPIDVKIYDDTTGQRMGDWRWELIYNAISLDDEKFPSVVHHAAALTHCCRLTEKNIYWIMGRRLNFQKFDSWQLTPSDPAIYGN